MARPIGAAACLYGKQVAGNSVALTSTLAVVNNLKIHNMKTNIYLCKKSLSMKDGKNGFTKDVKYLGRITEDGNLCFTDDDGDPHSVTPEGWGKYFIKQ